MCFWLLDAQDRKAGGIRALRGRISIVVNARKDKADVNKVVIPQSIALCRYAQLLLFNIQAQRCQNIFFGNFVLECWLPAF